jgi:hypothetical protein
MPSSLTFGKNVCKERISAGSAAIASSAASLQARSSSHVAPIRAARSKNSGEAYGAGPRERTSKAAATPCRRSTIG